MSDPGGVGGGGFPPGHERAKLVADLGSYLAFWEHRLRAPEIPGSDRTALGRWTSDLQVQARQVGFGGVAHHLSRCQAIVQAGGLLDAASLSGALKDLAELAWQSKQELSPDDRALVDNALQLQSQSMLAARAVQAPPSSLEPPPMLTVHPGLRGAGALPGGGPAGGHAGDAARAPMPSAAIEAPESLEPPRILSPIPPPPPGVRAPAVGPNSAFDPRQAPAGPKGVFESPPTPPANRPSEGPPSSDRARPNLAVRTMFRLRAFGQQAAEPPAPKPSPTGPGASSPGGASPILGLRGFSNVPPAPASPLAPPPIGAPGGGRSPGALPPLGGPGTPGLARPGALPPLGGSGTPGQARPPAFGERGTPGPGVPALPGPGAGNAGGPGAGMPRFLSDSLPPLPNAGEARSSSSSDGGMSDVLGRVGSKRESSSRRRESKGGKVGRRNREVPGSSFPWWLGVLAALSAGVLTLVAVLSWNRFRTRADNAPRPVASGASSAAPPAVEGSVAGLPSTPPTSKQLRVPTDDALEDVRLKAHGRGTKESPELKAWVDHQAALQAKLLETGRCEGSAAACAILFRAGEDTSTQRIAPKKPKTVGGGVRSRWLAGLRLPSIPVEDDIRVQRIFERYTETPVGREQVGQMLFRCGAYRDVIQATLIRYDLPPSLLAVVYAESACNPTIRSPVGAEGLWQFMPEAGRAYHLHITEDVLDERHSPAKATEAAVHFLADLYAKFGSWDLAFAAYNMGPYGLSARMQRAGGDVGFWDLLDADLLPSETSNYVPIIEAFALILENLQKLKFAGVQMRSPEVTGDLEAPPGTRLGLIARAASTSVNQIRSLNLDLKADVIPTIPGQRFVVQVPHESVWQARDALDALLAEASYDDQCVADNFDWGKQPYTKDMRDECRRRLAAPAAGRSSH